MGPTLSSPLKPPLRAPELNARGGLPHRLLPSVAVATLDPHPPNSRRRHLLPSRQAPIPFFSAPKLIFRRISAPPRRGRSVRSSRRGGRGAFAAAPATRVVVQPPVTPLVSTGSKETTRMRLVRLVGAIPRVRTAATTATTDLVAELKVGDALRTYRRRFTEGDVEAYAELSGHCSPVHVDDAIDRCPGVFRKGSVVHGMLVASLFPAVIASHFPGAVYASQSLRFAAPVFAGDVVLPQVQVLHIKATGESYIVKFATKCLVYDEATVAVDGVSMAFLPTLECNAEAIE